MAHASTVGGKIGTDAQQQNESLLSYSYSSIVVSVNVLSLLELI